MISHKQALQIDQGSIQYVFKPGARWKYPKSDGDMRVLILPAFNPADPQNNRAYIPYRDSADEFTAWFQPYFVHRMVMRTTNIISPKSFDPNAVDLLDRKSVV